MFWFLMTVPDLHMALESIAHSVTVLLPCYLFHAPVCHTIEMYMRCRCDNISGHSGGKMYHLENLIWLQICYGSLNSTEPRILKTRTSQEIISLSHAASIASNCYKLIQNRGSGNSNNLAVKLIPYHDRVFTCSYFSQYCTNGGVRIY